MTFPQLHIDVLDKGYVRYLDHMGDDLFVVNAARASFAKESAAMTKKDAGLLHFLIDRNEFSPFRHSMLSFEIYAPLMVARQWWKYVVGSDHRDPYTAWNETSRRYVTEDPEYYVPRWRGAPENMKQGSDGFVSYEVADEFTKLLIDRQSQSILDYENAIKAGIAPEQARMFLLAYGIYVRWRWTGSLEGVLWFLKQRLEHKAQWDMQEYSAAVHQLTKEFFPLCATAVGDPNGD